MTAVLHCASMRAAPLLRSAALLCLAAAAAGSPIEAEDVAAAAAEENPERLEPLVHMINDETTFESFLQLHKPGLGKVLFFSKLGKSELCDSLAEHYDGQLDFLHVPPSAVDVVAKFSLEEAPAIFVLPAETLSKPEGDDGNTLSLVQYEGAFKFGAFDRIVEFLDKFAPPVPALPVIGSQAEFEEQCGGPLPCLVMLVQGPEGEVHSLDLVPKLAKLVAGDKLVTVVVDVEQWRAPLIQLQTQAPSALFVGPFGTADNGYIVKLMPPVAEGKFTVRFTRQLRRRGSSRAPQPLARYPCDRAS